MATNETNLDSRVNQCLYEVHRILRERADAVDDEDTPKLKRLTVELKRAKEDLQTARFCERNGL